MQSIQLLTVCKYVSHLWKVDLDSILCAIVCYHDINEILFKVMEKTDKKWRKTQTNVLENTDNYSYHCIFYTLSSDIDLLDIINKHYLCFKIYVI